MLTTPCMEQPKPSDPYEQTARRDIDTAGAALATVQAALADPTPASEETILKISRLALQMQQLPPTVATDIQFAVLQAVGRYFLAREQHLQFGMEAASYISILARRLGRRQELLNGLMMQGVIAVAMQNSIEAIESFVAARDLALELMLPRAECVAVMNGGVALLDAGHYSEALKTFEHCLTLTDRCTNVNDVIGTLWSNVAQCHLVLSNYEEGLQAIARAKDFVTEPADAHVAGVRATLESTHIRLLVASKRGPEAPPLLLQLEKYVMMAGSRRARIELTIARGLVEAIVLKHRDVGLTLIRRAITAAATVPSTQLDALAAMVSASEQSGVLDDAAKYRAELQGLISTRRETSRFRAELLKPGLGIGAAITQDTAYESRLREAHDRLLQRSQRS